MAREITLGDLAYVNPPRPKLISEPDTEVSFIPMGDVSDDGRWSSRQVRPFREVAKGYTVFQDNDVLFAKITPCMENGKGALVSGLQNGVGFGSTEFHIIRARPYADPGFLFQWTVYEPFRRKAAAAMTGSAGQQRVPASFIETFRIPAFGKLEQTKITEVLSTVDRAIEQTEALMAKQQRIKTGLMQDLLTLGIDNHGTLRSEQLHEFTDSPCGRIPGEWELRELGSVSEFVTSGSRGWAKYYSTEGPIFLRIGNLTRSHINLRFDDIIHVNPPRTAEGVRTAARPGDLLISITADLGIIGVVPDDFGETYVNQHIALVRLLRQEVDPRFVGWFLSSRGGQMQFERLNESGAKSGLNLPTVRKLLVPCPKLEEQVAIAQTLDSCAEEARRLQAQLTKLRSLKTALMQDLLTGRKPVTPLLTPTEDTPDDRGQNPEEPEA